MSEYSKEEAQQTSEQSHFPSTKKSNVDDDEDALKKKLKKRYKITEVSP